MYKRKCDKCEFLNVISRDERNRGRKKYQYADHGICFCAHKDAKYLSKAFTTGSSEPAFIALATEENLPDRKMAPKWCPVDIQERPVQISKRQAYEIIRMDGPRGLFFVDEITFWSAIDYRFEEAVVEEFQTVTECKNWLIDRAKQKEYQGV